MVTDTLTNGMLQPIFVVGMPRSGTTVLGSAIGSSDACIVIPEAQFLVDGLQKFGTKPLKRETFMNYITRHYRFKIWGFRRRVEIKEALPKTASFAHFFDSLVRVYGEGSPKATFFVEHAPTKRHNLDLLHEIYPSAIFVHVVRDGRAVLASSKKVKWGQQDVISLARAWSQGVQATETSLKECVGDGAKSFVFKYEEFILSQGAVLSSLFDELGLPTPKIHTLNFNVPSYTRQQHALLGGKFDASRINSWREELSKREIEIFEYFGQHQLKYYAYDLLSSYCKAPSKSETTVILMTGIAKRAMNKFSVSIKRLYYSYAR